jgi:hypothetical protein
MKSIILVLITLTCWAADPSAQPLPPEATKIQVEHDAAVAKAKAAFDQAVAKADQEAVKKLEPVVVKITKAGDLKGANAAQALLDGWKAGQGDLLGEAKVDLVKLLTKNKWTLSTGFEKVAITFQANGTTGSRVKEYSKWKIDGDLLSIIWDTDVVECQMQYDPKSNSFVQDDKFKSENRDKARLHSLTLQQPSK